VTTEHDGQTPARVPKAANHAGEDPRTAGLDRDWPWTEPTVWTARMLAALERGVKGGKWYSLIDKVQSETTLRAAFAAVAANQGAAGVDHVSVEHFTKDRDANLRRLSEELRQGRYRPDGPPKTSRSSFVRRSRDAAEACRRCRRWQASD